jgi:hypothetical protein
MTNEQKVEYVPKEEFRRLLKKIIRENKEALEFLAKR